MLQIVDILKSRGKIGGAGLMALGLGMVAYSFFKGAGQYQEGMVTFFMGLAAFGIRAKQDK